MVDLISLGAGTQSSTLLLMAEKGEILPRPAAAIFADTGDEPRAVYEWLEYLKTQTTIPIYTGRRVMTLGNTMSSLAGQKENEIVIGQGGTVPFFTINQDGSHGMLNRHCTANYKIDVLHRVARRLYPDTEAYTQWIGISADEAHRMRPSRVARFTNRYPLAMEAQMTRADCYAWMERNGYPRPPRSACYFCPYHSDDEWRSLPDEEFQRAVAFEKVITHGLRGTRGKRFFLHASRVPLDEVDFSTPSDHGQMGLWGEECEGMCGL